MAKITRKWIELTLANSGCLRAQDVPTSSGSSIQAVLDNHIGSGGSSHQLATTSTHGFMSSSDKSKLNGIEAGAQVNTVTSVAGKTGAVTLTKSDVGLENVQNVDQTNASNITSGTLATGRLSLNIFDPNWVRFANQATFVSDSLGATLGRSFDIFDCINFDPNLQGEAWFQFPVNPRWNTASSVSIRVGYNLPITDSSKNIIINTSVWLVNEGATPAIGSPNASSSTTISSANVNKLSYQLLNTTVPSGFSANTLIVIRFVRDAANTNDTYSGNFQLISLALLQ